MSPADMRMSQFRAASRCCGLKARTAGGPTWQMAVAGVVLTLASTVSSAQDQTFEVAKLEERASLTGGRAVLAEETRSVVSRAMTARCRPASMAEALAAPRMGCRAVTGIGVESSLDLVKDAELMGEFDGYPVFLSDSRTSYIAHIESRGGDSGKWVPMLVLSRGLVDRIRALDPGLQHAATVFLLGRQKELTKTAWEDAADFAGLQRMGMVESDLDRSQAAALSVLALVPASDRPGGSVDARAAIVRSFFTVARDMRDAASASAPGSRFVQR